MDKGINTIKLFGLNRGAAQPPQPALRFGSQFKDFMPMARGLDQVYAETDYFHTNGAPPKSGTPPETIMGWRLLPKLVRQTLRPVLEAVKPGQIKEKLRKGHVLQLEEGADTWYETVGSMLAQEGVLSDQDSVFQKAQAGLVRLKDESPEGHPAKLNASLSKRIYYPSDKEIGHFIDMVRHSLPAEQVETAAKLIFRPGRKAFLKAPLTTEEQDNASTLLTLTYIRLATLKDEKKYDQLTDYLHKQWRGEFDELKEALQGQERRLKRHLGRLVVRHTQPTNQAGQRPIRVDFDHIQQLITTMLSHSLGRPVTPKDLFQQYLHKHLVRQGIRLKAINDDKMSYDMRKSLSKRVEAALLGSVLVSNGSRATD